MTKNDSALVALEKVGLNRSGRWIVRGIDLTVWRGEIVTLIGPNGSGKTTTAKLALGVLKADEGIASRLPNLQVGYVPQKISVDWTLPLSVERFVALTHRIATTEVIQALALAGVKNLLNAQVGDLSGGEFQRVMLARAIACKPELLVLDEPVQGVDFVGEAEVYDLIMGIRKDLDCGLLLISHDLHVVMAATDKVICLNGHVCCSGTPKMVASNEEYKKLFGSRASSILAVYEHSHDHTHLPSGRVQHADGTITDDCHPADGHHDSTLNEFDIEGREHLN